MVDYTIRPPAARSKGKRRNAFIRALTAIFPANGDSVTEIIRKIVFLVAVIALVITGGQLLMDIRGEMTQMYVVSTKVENDKNGGILNLSQETINKIQAEKPYIREDLIGLYAKNNDLVGYFNLGDEEKIIDYPVVQTDNNDTYLTTGFYGESIKSGTIFADYRCEFDENGNPPNFVVMYGHNTNSGLMFSKLTRYYYEKDNPDPNDDWLTSFARKHPTVRFDTLAGDGVYKVFACCLFNTEEQYGEVYDYLRRGRPFESAEEFNQYIIDIMDRSAIFTDVDLTYGDDIICMSTCYFPFGMEYENVRCAVFARKVREGESPEVDTSKVTRNFYWVGWQQAIDRNIACPPYAGGKWDTSKLLSY